MSDRHTEEKVLHRGLGHILEEETIIDSKPRTEQGEAVKPDNRHCYN